MTYALTLYDADGATPEQHREAERRFRRALEASLGDEALVLPVYAAYLRIAAAYGDEPAADALTDAEREVFDQWQVAEAAALAATFGTHRYMGDAMYRIEEVVRAEMPEQRMDNG